MIITCEVELSILMGVGGYGCIASVKVVLIGTDTCTLWNMVLVSASV